METICSQVIIIICQKYIAAIRLLFSMIIVTVPVQKIMNTKDLLVKYVLVTICPVRENFLANSENKKQFINASNQFLENDRIPCIWAKEDTDTDRKICGSFSY